MGVTPCPCGKCKQKVFHHIGYRYIETYKVSGMAHNYAPGSGNTLYQNRYWIAFNSFILNRGVIIYVVAKRPRTNKD